MLPLNSTGKKNQLSKILPEPGEGWVKDTHTLEKQKIEERERKEAKRQRPDPEAASEGMRVKENKTERERRGEQGGVAVK